MNRGQQMTDAERQLERELNILHSICRREELMECYGGTDIIPYRRKLRTKRVAQTKLVRKLHEQTLKEPE